MALLLFEESLDARWRRALTTRHLIAWNVGVWLYFIASAIMIARASAAIDAAACSRAPPWP
jgi:hypothetical protein